MNIQSLGKGGFGVVTRTTHETLGSLAIKSINKIEEKAFATLLNEIDVMV